MNVLVIVAHPDDEILGVGGTLIRHVKNGDQVYVLILCENSSLRYGGKIDTASSARKAAALMGTKLEMMGLPDQHLDHVPFTGLVRRLERRVREIVPDLLYTHWHDDLNRDHRITSEAVRVATRPRNGRPFEIREFYTPSSTEYSADKFRPDTWVNITRVVPEKMMAMQQYQSELERFPHPRSLRGLSVMSQFFGSQVGVCHAEAFVTVLRVI